MRLFEDAADEFEDLQRAHKTALQDKAKFQQVIEKCLRKVAARDTVIDAIREVSAMEEMEDRVRPSSAKDASSSKQFVPVTPIRKSALYNLPVGKPTIEKNVFGS